MDSNPESGNYYWLIISFHCTYTLSKSPPISSDLISHKVNFLEQNIFGVVHTNITLLYPWLNCQFNYVKISRLLLVKQIHYVVFHVALIWWERIPRSQNYNKQIYFSDTRELQNPKFTGSCHLKFRKLLICQSLSTFAPLTP